MPIRHTVQQGESIVSLADRYGHFADTIWNHGDNAALKEKRGDMSILAPGDVVVIPDKRKKEVSKADKEHHRFKRKGVPAVFRVQVFDVEEPRANQEYRLVVDGKVYTGTTDAEGVLEQFVDPMARSARLVIGAEEQEYLFDLGHLNPIEELSGVQQRLNNLGYDCSEANGQMGERTAAALRAFQGRYGLKVTGEADQATRDKLVELNDDVHEIPEQGA